MSRRKPRPVNELTMMEILEWSTFKAPEWRPFRDAWHARGFSTPPAGDSDDRTTQRGMLAEIAFCGAQRLADWVREAPGVTRHEVIEYVLDRWHGVMDDVKRGELEVIAERERLAQEVRQAQGRRGDPRAMGGSGGTGRPGDLGGVGGAFDWSAIRALATAQPDGVHRRTARPTRIGTLLGVPDGGPRQGPDQGGHPAATEAPRADPSPQ